MLASLLLATALAAEPTVASPEAPMLALAPTSSNAVDAASTFDAGRLKRAHALVVAGRVTAVSGVVLTVGTIPLLAATGRCAFAGPAGGSTICNAPYFTGLTGLAATATGLGMMAGGSAGYLKAANEAGVKRSPVPALAVMGTGVAMIGAGAVMPHLEVEGGAGVAGVGILTVAVGAITMDQIHMSARRGVEQKVSVRPTVDFAQRTVGIAGRF